VKLIGDEFVGSAWPRLVDRDRRAVLSMTMVSPVVK
jgi:hypothetical protein